MPRRRYKRMEWTTVRIPIGLLEEVDKIVGESPYYVNKPEFIREAIREKVKRVETFEEEKGLRLRREALERK